MINNKKLINKCWNEPNVLTNAKICGNICDSYSTFLQYKYSVSVFKDTRPIKTIREYLKGEF